MGSDGVAPREDEMETVTAEQEKVVQAAVSGETRPVSAGRSPAVAGSRPRVVIVGSGFGGLNAARALAGTGVDVLVLDRNNYHGFWPLLYQVATAGIEPESIAYPARAILRKYDNADFVMAEVKGVDFEHKQVLTDGVPIAYDYLVLAAGSANNY